MALAVRVKLGAPVLFRQERAGKDGRPFTMVKFRTMRTGAGTDAERLGRFGRFLRASSLDELPELFLVLAGKTKSSMRVTLARDGKSLKFSQ